MMTDWRIGQKAVCIAERRVWRPRSWRLRLLTWLDSRYRDPAKGAVYTVAGVSARALGDGRMALKLREIAPAWWFHAAHFRPLVEADADLAQFQALLERVNARAPARAG